LTVAGDCIEVSGNGNPGLPYTVSFQVNPAANNQLSCLDDGAYVPPPSIGVLDSDCINISGTGFPGDPVTVELLLNGDACNLSDCAPGGGLLTQLFTQDTDCIELTGCGTTGNPLVATIPLSIDTGNVVECHSDGLYVPSVATGSVTHYGELAATVPTIVPAGVGVVTAPIIQDLTVTNVGGIADPANNRFLVPLGGGGWYWAQSLIEYSSGLPFSRGTANGFQVRHQLHTGGDPGLVRLTLEKYSSLGFYSIVQTLVQLFPGDSISASVVLTSDTGVAFPATSVVGPSLYAARIGV